MNVSRSLTFLGTPLSVAASIVAVLATGVFCFVAWRRSGYRTSMGLLELLRLGLVAFVAILLNQPEWIEEFRPSEKPAIAVLWDASASMDTRDALAGGSESGAAAPVTRREAIASLTQDSTWQKLRERMNVVIQPFAEPRAGHGTDLNDPLVRAPQRIQNLRGVVLASDGDWNEGQPPVLAAAASADAGRAHLCGSGGKPVAAAGRRALELRPADLRRGRQVGARAVLDRQLAAARVQHDGHHAFFRRR